jgi:hypothetical protein
LNLMLGGGNHTFIDWNADDIEASLLDQTDSGTITAAFEDYDEVDAPVVVANTNMPAISVATGVLTAASALTFTAVTGDAADYLVVFKNSGTPSTSPLAITWDSASTGLPVTPNGGNIVATWGSNIVATLA